MTIVSSLIPMAHLKSRLAGANPEVTKLIIKSYPLFKNRSPWWFFRDDLLNNRTDVEKDIIVGDRLDLRGIDTTKLPKYAVDNIWRNMNPESKWKYYNMAIFDAIRYKEQRSLWITKVAPLLNEQISSVKSVQSLLPTEIDHECESYDLLNRYQTKYEKFITASSALKLVRDFIHSQKTHEPVGITMDDVISTIPEECRPILAKPKVPRQIQLVWSNKACVRRHMKKTSETSFCKAAGSLWRDMKESEKKKYKELNDQLLEQYYDAMEEFRFHFLRDGAYLPQVFKERALFKQTLRKKLRKSKLSPKFCLSAPNFFTRDHVGKSIPSLGKYGPFWAKVSKQEREKYHKLVEEDRIRYAKDKEQYDDMLNDIMCHIETICPEDTNVKELKRKIKHR